MFTAPGEVLGSRSPGEDPAGETGLNIRNTIAELSADNKVGEKNSNLENKLYCLWTIKYLEIPFSNCQN